MQEHNKRLKDIHISKGFTQWAHRHHRLAVWLMRGIVAGLTALLFFFKKEQKKIEDEKM